MGLPATPQAAPPAGAGPVAGTIEKSPSTLEAAFELWASHARAEGRGSRTVQTYLEQFRQCARDEGVTDLAGYTRDVIVGWMARKRDSGAWKKGTTYNRNLTAFRSLTRVLAKRGVIPADFLADEDRAKDDGGDGARAASTDEARWLIAEAHARVSRTKHSHAARDVYYLTMAKLACRFGDAARLEWKRHVFLEEEVPFVRFTKDINKNGRDEIVPLDPELAAVLRLHREAMRELATTAEYFDVCFERGPMVRRWVDPDLPGSFVFPRLPTRAAFRQDARRAGIPYLDRFGDPFTPHSLRKWFDTELVEAGHSDRAVKALMRHAGDVAGRYYKPDLERKAARIAQLPRLWPRELSTGSDRSGRRAKKKIENVGLTTGSVSNNMSGRLASPRKPDSIESRPDPDSPLASPESGSPGRDLLESFFVPPPRTRSTNMSSQMPNGVLISVDRVWLAQVLEGAARALSAAAGVVRSPGAPDAPHARVRRSPSPTVRRK